MLIYIIIYLQYGSIPCLSTIFTINLTKTKTRLTIAFERAMFVLKMFVNLNRSYTEQCPGQV